MSIMFGALRLGLKAWDKGEQDTDIMHRVRIVKTLMKRQIASINTTRLLNAELHPKPMAFILKGTQNSMEFISNYSIVPDTKIIPVYVRYFVNTNKGTDDLVMEEHEISTLNEKSLRNIAKTYEEDSLHVLLKNVHDFSFEYLKKNIEGYNSWYNSWNMDLDKSVDFPIAVKISFVVDKIQFSLIAKIMSDSEKIKGVK